MREGPVWRDLAHEDLTLTLTLTLTLALTQTSRMRMPSVMNLTRHSFLTVLS